MLEFAAGSSFFKGPKRMKIIMSLQNSTEMREVNILLVLCTPLFGSFFVILQRALIYVTDIPLRLVTTLPGVHSNLETAPFLSPSEGPDSEG